MISSVDIMTKWVKVTNSKCKKGKVSAENYISLL